MAFSTTVHDRHLDEMRFRSIDGQQPFPAAYVPLRATPSELNPNPQPATAEIRVGLTRRFTDAMNPPLPPPQLATVWDPSRLARIPVAETLDLAPGNMDADVRQQLSPRSSPSSPPLLPPLPPRPVLSWALWG